MTSVFERFIPVIFTMNYFDFYHLPLSFRVDEPALRAIFLKNSRKYHPDFHTLATEAQQDEMLELSTLNNQAFKTLSDPDRRMRYVLELKELLGDESKQPPLSQDFLMEMMDINENLMELEFEPDPARYEQTLKDVKSLESSLLSEVQPILDSYGDVDTLPAASDPELIAVRDYFLKRRYLLRILENLSKFAPR